MNPQPRYKKGDKIGGRYQVHQALMGGMGEVYLCLDLETIQPYALKTFRQRYLTNPKLRAAFENEVATWVALEKHPNVVRCFYMDILDNQPFMFLEWIAGEEGRGTDLRGWLRRGPLNLRTALDFTIDICRGLIHAQEKQPGLVHRDLKPENILIAQGGLAKVTDFGLAKIVQDAELEISATELPVDKGPRRSNQGGTYQYMAPEQWLGDELDQRTDIYAVGCILYEMLTGRRPFQAATTDGLRRQHLEANIPTLGRDQTLPRALDILLAGCLAKRRNERLASAAALLEELSQIFREQFGESWKSVVASEGFTVGDYVNRGLTYWNLQRYEEALADYTQAIQLEPTNPWIYNNRGNACYSLRRYQEALADLDRALQLDPHYVKAYANRGFVYAALERYEEALADQTRAIQAEPTEAKYYNNRGTAYSNLGRYQEALADFSRAIQLDPAYAEAYYNRGIAYDSLRRYEEALADYTCAIQLDPVFAYAYYNRAETLSELQRYEEALMDYTQAIRIDPTDADFYIGRGVVYADLQHYDAALADQTNAIELDPSRALAYYNRARIHQYLQRYKEALTDYARAIQLDSSLARSYINRGLVYHDLQQYEKALEDYDQAIQLDPVCPQAYYNRARTYTRLQRHSEALADYTRAIEINLAYTKAYTNRGIIYQKLGRYKEAVADTLRAIELEPMDPKAYLIIGTILANGGALSEALPYLEQATQLGDPQGAQLAQQVRRALRK